MMHSVSTIFDASATNAVTNHVVTFMAQQQSGPLGADFGKASPIGLLIIVLLLIVILILGWDLSRRAKRMAARRRFAEEHGMDPFDTEAIEKAMREAELNDATQ